MNDLYNPKPSQIVMYVTEYCPDCRRARRYFDENKIAYLKVDIDENREAANFVISVNRGNRSVPTIIFPDGSTLVEPSLSEMQTKLSGYAALNS
jgi:mycoredoxin